MRLSKDIHHHAYWRLAFCALAVAILLTACGGSDDSTTTSSNSGGSATVTAFPTGVALSSPASLDSTSNVVASAMQQQAPWDVRLADWGRAMWTAMQAGDSRMATTLVLKLLPMSEARAAATKVPEGAVVASEIEAVAKGTLSFNALLKMDELFTSSVNNASCFGPSVGYTGHDDWTAPTMQHATADGNLPSGDLGMWTSMSTDNFGTNLAPNDITQPCAIAQLNKRLDGTKKQVRQAMLLMAGLRRLITVSDTLDMPTAGNATNVQAALSTVLAGITELNGTTVDSASVSLNGAGTLYTYRITLSTGSGATAKQGEIVIQHTPGASATQFSGVLQITAAQLGSDGAFGCNDETTTIGGTSYFNVATVTTIRYDRNGTAMDIGARTGFYCGAPAPSSTSYIDDLATLDVDGMLDFGTHLNGNNNRAGVKGWRGNVSRFGATMDIDTLAGDFVYIWQAGNLDGMSRAFAVHTTHNSVSEARGLDAYFGFSNAIDDVVANMDLRGMICNWAGPNNSHTPNTKFQSQSASLGASATVWSLDSSKITYAPTTSCDSSSTMNFDVNANNTVGAGEGASVANDLDTLTTGTDVPDELSDRGFTRPNFF